MSIENMVQKWLSSDSVANETKEEIRDMDEKLKQDAFYKNLDFGTGGMRGVLGAGTNRMNIYTIRRVTQGLFMALGEENQKKGVAIAYDTRNFSDVFAHESTIRVHFRINHSCHRKATDDDIV